MLCHRILQVAGLAALLAIPSSAIAAPTIVYDNTSTPVTGDFIPSGLPEGFWPFNQYGDDPVGDQIALAGTDRAVTRFDLIVSSSAPTVLTNLTLVLYKNDGTVYYGAPGAPGTVLWTGALADVAVDGLTMVVFDVPNVVVPNMFSWTAAADSNIAGLATYDPPTVGSTPMWGPIQHAWDLDTASDDWYPFYFEDNPVANFGARVWAVPGPGCLSLLAAGGLAALHRRRRWGK